MTEEELNWDPYEDSNTTNDEHNIGCLEIAIIFGALGFLANLLVNLI